MQTTGQSTLGAPYCDICGQPASAIWDEGVCLCSAHDGEARELRLCQGQIEWSLTEAGLRALAACEGGA